MPEPNAESIFTVGTTAVYVGADSTNQKKIVKASGDALYYKTSSDVDSGDTELSTSLEISAGNWLVSAGSTRVLVQDHTTVVAQDVTALDDITVTDDLTVTDAATVGSTLGVTGATTLTGGVTASGPDRIWAGEPGTGIALASIGQEAAPTAKTEYFTTVFVPVNKTLTGAAVLWATIAGTDKVVYYLHNNAGAVVANTATAGTTSGDSNTFQEIAFTAPYAAVGPARYHIGVQSNGTTDKLQFADSAFAPGNFNGTKALAAFGTGEAITPATTFSDATGPIAYLY